MGADGVIPISFDESLQLDSRHTHAAHCLIWFEKAKNKFGFMQMRSDGRIGFPGGGVEEKCPSVNEIVDALNRELMEEINYDSKVRLTDYVSSHLHLKPSSSGKLLITHFFMKRVEEEEFLRIERTHHQAIHFPEESLGMFRVPVSMESKFYRNFSCHTFAGNARDQLFDAINILSD